MVHTEVRSIIQHSYTNSVSIRKDVWQTRLCVVHVLSSTFIFLRSVQEISSNICTCVGKNFVKYGSFFYLLWNIQSAPHCQHISLSNFPKILQLYFIRVQIYELLNARVYFQSRLHLAPRFNQRYIFLACAMQFIVLRHIAPEKIIIQKKSSWNKKRHPRFCSAIAHSLRKGIIYQLFMERDVSGAERANPSFLHVLLANGAQTLIAVTNPTRSSSRSHMSASAK